MYKSILPLTISLLFLYGCLQEAKTNYQNFQKKEIYQTHFSEPDDVFWVGNDGKNLAIIENGEYYFKSLDTNGRWNAPPFSFNPGNDFEIEISLTRQEKDKEGYYGLVLGRLKPDSAYLKFEINNSGEYKIGGNFEITRGNVDTQNFSNFKKLAIQKIGAELSFFINETYIYSYKSPGFLEFRFGPLVNSGMGVWVDYISLSELVNPCL